MAINLYKTWFRPSLMAFTASAPIPNNAVDGSWNISGTAGTDYIFITDDNRSDLQVSLDRIEYRKRMIDGTMRSYHVADKKLFSISWADIPSSASYVSENRTTFAPGWAGGKEILNWYENNTDSFYVLLVYDTPNPEGTGDIPVKYRVETYNVFFESFTYNVKTRGAIYDLWDMSLSLAEV